LRRELKAEKASRQENDTALRAEMATAERVAAEVLSDAINGTAEKAETQLLRAQTVAAKKASTAARKAADAAEQVAKDATAVREAESLKRVAAQRELQRLRSEQKQMMEEAARTASVEDGVRLQALRQQATSARAESAAVRAASYAEIAAVRTAAAAEMNEAAEQVAQAAGQVRSEQRRRGIAEGKQATATAMQERGALLAHEELNLARAEVARLREALAEAEAQATGKRRPAAQETARLVGCRLWDADDAPLSARDQTFAVQLVEETNSSFQGASTAVALVLGWLFGEEALGMGKYLLSPNTFSRAVEVMGTLNDDAVRKVNAADTGPWGAVADGANKGRTADLLAYNKADAAGLPQSAPMGVHDLYSDQRTVNNVTTALRAIVHAGLPASTMVSFLTDGTEHALQEARGVCDRMANSAEGKPRPAWSVGSVPKPETCGIHGLALEENGGIKAALPGEYHTHGALLLWEIVAAREGGRPDEYRAIWTKDLRHVDPSLLPLPEHIFDVYLARLTKSTTSKWEVSGMASRQILMLLEPPEGRVAGSRSMLEIFLHKCRLLFCGSLDDDKVLTLTLTPSPSPHPHPHPHPSPQAPTLTRRSGLSTHTCRRSS
jgi:hypothetical protein